MAPLCIPSSSPAPTFHLQVPWEGGCTPRSRTTHERGKSSGLVRRGECSVLCSVAEPKSLKVQSQSPTKWEEIQNLSSNFCRLSHPNICLQKGFALALLCWHLHLCTNIWKLQPHHKTPWNLWLLSSTRTAKLKPKTLPHISSSVHKPSSA